MNIFYLDPNPKTCAQMHCDKHVVKMIIEYAQLLSTAHRVLDGTLGITLSNSGRKRQTYSLDDDRDGILYSATHINHPSAIWVREDEKHYRWLFLMWTELLDEYTHRYGKIHACARLESTLSSPPLNIPYGNEFFAPTPAMPPELKIVAPNAPAGRKYDVLASYKNYYIKDKARFAKWKNRAIPNWFAETQL